MKETRQAILDAKTLAYKMDPVVLKLDTTFQDVEMLAEACKKYSFGCCFGWPCHYEMLSRLLEGSDTVMGCSVGFPSGQEETSTKVYLVKKFLQYGPGEVDMMMNVGMLKSGLYDQCYDDMAAVREACPGTSMKVIIEAMLLSDDEIEKACQLAMRAGVDYIKTGSGFSVNMPTRPHHIRVIKDVVGDRMKIKASGGIRDLDTLLNMYALGADRFGVSLNAAIAIVEKIRERGEVDTSLIVPEC